MTARNVKDILELKGEGEHLRLIVPRGLKGRGARAQAGAFLEKAAAILKDAPVVVEIKGEGWGRDDIFSIVETVLLPAGASVLSWSPEGEDVRSWMKREGFALFSPAPETEAPAPVRPVAESLVVDESLRSGRKVEHDGDVMVLGNVNEGAEVFAGRSVLVLGRLRGLAHAGLTAPEEAFIVSGHFEANQVRIGDRISYMTEDCPWWNKTVSMRILDGSIVVREVIP